MHIVKIFGDVKLQASIKIHCESINIFEISTSVSVYLKAINSARPDGEICKGFEQMAVKMNKSTDQCSLHEIQQLKEAIAESAAVHSLCIWSVERLRAQFWSSFLFIQTVHRWFMPP